MITANLFSSLGKAVQPLITARLYFNKCNCGAMKKRWVFIRHRIYRPNIQYHALLCM